jgi:AcrR family transcriptional regulator
MSVPTATATAPANAAVETRDRLLDATERCLRRSGIRRTTMIEIANEAGISRAWLYRHFPDKASLVLAALARIDEEFWIAARDRISAVEGIATQVAAAVVFSREHQPGAALLRLRDEEPEAFTAVVGRGLQEMMPGMARFWYPYLEAARDRGEVRADLDIARAGEWVMRVVMSLVTIPGEAVDATNPDGVRRFIEEFLVAGLG